MVDADSSAQQNNTNAQAHMDQTINDRAGGDLHVNTNHMEERKGGDVIDNDNWIEVRLQGKLPERRSNHCAFIATLRHEEQFLYVHGGRDLKEGSIATMWRLNLNNIHEILENGMRNDQIGEWEHVQTQGRGPGRISHHTASVLPSKEVVFYGGLKGEDSNSEVFLFNPSTCVWLVVNFSNASHNVLPRDDHVMSRLSNGDFLVFGGFINGSRVNELASFTMTNQQTIQGNIVSDLNNNGACPIPRASFSSAVYNDKLYVYGGQDDDNNKLEDLWEYDNVANSWRQIQMQEGALRPFCRSGHSAVTYGSKMYIFGGILELTKELNDMLVFDFETMQFCQGEERPDYMDGSPDRRQTIQQDEDSPSPTRTQKGNSPTRRRTIGGGLGGASPLKSPMKRTGRLGSKEPAAREGGEARRDGPGTPTSVTMMNTFIIKNADQSFDLYHQQMKKRRQQFGGYDANATSNESKFGLIRGTKPTARDGHISLVDSKGYMYVFGGDRHLMPFNDLYMIKLA